MTRTQRIRTAAAIPVLATIADAASSPAYLVIGPKARHLRELGLSDRRIARAIRVSDKKSLQRCAIDESLGALDDPRGPEDD